jgi:hypothetical protein
MQHSYNITNLVAKGGSAYRAAVNAALQALVTQNEGPAEPAVTYPSMLWPDTTASLLKLRNQANDGWLTIGNLEEVHLGLAALAAENEFVTTQKLKGDGLLLRFTDTGPSGAEWAIRSTGGNFEIVRNIGSEGSPTWTTQVRVSDTGIEAGIEAGFVGPISQTVLSAAVDSNGKPAFISMGTGLSVDIAATATPVRIAFASGSADYVGIIDEDTSISSLTASNTNYLYAERNPGTGAITLGKTTVMPVHSYAAPPHASGQYWYSISQRTMYLSNGSDTWTEKQLVFLGEAVTDGSEVTSVVNYALNGHFVGSQVTPLPGNTTVFSQNHNLGVVPDHAMVEFVCLSAEHGYSAGDVVRHISIYGSSSAWYGSPMTLVVNRLSCKACTGENYTTVQSMSTGKATTLTAGNWAYRFRADRGW